MEAPDYYTDRKLSTAETYARAMEANPSNCAAYEELMKLAGTFRIDSHRITAIHLSSGAANHTCRMKGPG